MLAIEKKFDEKVKELKSTLEKLRDYKPGVGTDKTMDVISQLAYSQIIGLQDLWTDEIQGVLKEYGEEEEELKEFIDITSSPEVEKKSPKEGDPDYEPEAIFTSSSSESSEEDEPPKKSRKEDK
jgi:hypothetical protein